MSVDVYDCEPYSVCETRQRRARKEHTCDACKETIRRGDLYSNTFTVLEGESETIKRCLKCDVIYKHLFAAMDTYEEQPDPRLNCGHSYEKRWGTPPPDDLARLAFMTPDEVQREYARKDSP